MRITPLDIQKHRFRRTLRGYDANEVQAFLTSFAEQYEMVIRENQQQREESALLREQVKEHEERGRILKQTLLTAQQAAEDVREAARREAETEVKEAELKAERMMEVARERIGRYEGRLIELKTLKRELVDRIEAMIRSQSALLADWRELDEADNLKFLDAARREDETESAG
jgi:cell division initiation protein